ncbi:hypothetical protein QYS49_23875 [Marivirga salinae]|uniref:Uncharacterized protein n=1 Tax=Marivirga salinarum TaxID=3059078 RepID=A0AA49J8H7_9BACT|nr:hypothetical protein [Marivirga sp. BDSF4-3]WKK74708.1 hypothetical protein QYS49_23875 [Marivirga sp. BDSF4-3]
MIIAIISGLILIVIITIILFKNRPLKGILISVSLIVILTAGGLYFLKYFISSFAPPKVTISKNDIVTNREFNNGVTIEKINVDSIGDEGYPIKYTTIHTVSCNIRNPSNKPPNPPSKIEFYEPGNYSWDEDTIKVKHIHKGFSRQSESSSDKLWWLNKYGKYPICPLKFESEQWYFFSIGDRRVTGIFFYIDKKGIEHQYFLESGVSPI